MTSAEIKKIIADVEPLEFGNKEEALKKLKFDLWYAEETEKSAAIKARYEESLSYQPWKKHM